MNTIDDKPAELIFSRDSPSCSTHLASTPIPITFGELIRRSNEFEATTDTSFSTLRNRVRTLGTTDEAKAQIEQHAKQTWPIIDSKTFQLIEDFLAYKCQYGSIKERSLYQGMSPEVLIDRLLTKRPLMFMKAQDVFISRFGLYYGRGGFEAIGKDTETEPLILNEYLSYDEMAIAALVGVSVSSFFINNGRRDNCGENDPDGSYERSGIITGLVGARFEKVGLMEWQHLLITAEQNTQANGYGANGRPEKSQALSHWAKFYGEGTESNPHFPTYETASADISGKFIKLEEEKFLNVSAYKIRLRRVIEPFLKDANERARHDGKKAYIHAVGLGLGVWMIDQRQAQLQIDVYREILKNEKLEWVADIDFSWFPEGCRFDPLEECPVSVHFSKRNPADKLEGSNAGKLLVISYPWDSNAYPGNEYWMGLLDASGDPAAACFSTIAELQNPFINPNVSGLRTHLYRSELR